MLKPLAIILAAAALSGCASASKTYGPDGRPSYSLNCSGGARSWGMCYEKAGEICGEKGYDVVAQNGESGFVSTAGVNANGGGSFAGSTHGRTLLISCKP